MTTQNNDAKFTFLYLLSLVALIFTALATGIIFFQIINKLVPDNLGYMGAMQESVKFAIAALVVAAPVYYWVAWQLNRNLVKGHLATESAARRWLTYLILFVAAVTSLGWLIATFNVFFDGGLSLRFALKLVTVLAVTGLAFGFYFYDIRRQAVKRGDKIIMAFLIASLLMVLTAFTAAWFVVDSPAVARAKNHDRQILNDFSQIENSISTYMADNKKLPVSLEELLKSRSYLNSGALKNEVSEQAYEYKVVGEESYQLCAEFKTDNRNSDDSEGRNNYLEERWRHDAGQQCLTQQVFKPALKD